MRLGSTSLGSTYVSRIRSGIAALRTGIKFGFEVTKTAKMGIKISAVQLDSLPHSNNWVLTSGWIIRTCETKRKTSVAISDRFWPDVDVLTLGEAVQIGRNVKDLAHMFVVSEQVKGRDQWTAHIDLQRLLKALAEDKYLMPKDKIAEVFKGTDNPAYASNKAEAESLARSNVMGNLNDFLIDYFDNDHKGLRYCLV